jgi:hypothetical protein
MKGKLAWHSKEPISKMVGMPTGNGEAIYSVETVGA